MRLPFLAALAVLPLLVGCGALGGFSNAIQESGALQERADKLEAKMELLDQTLEAYGPVAESFGPDVQAAYDKLVGEYTKVQSAVAEGRELLTEAVSLHEASLASSTGEDGETDWVQYALLMLMGGGGLASERLKTGKERNKLHARIDARGDDVKGLEAKLAQLMHTMEVETALRAEPPA